MNGRRPAASAGLKTADSRLVHCSEEQGYSITASARKKRGRDFETECSGSFEVGVNLVSIWLFDREVGGLDPWAVRSRTTLF